MNFSKSQIFNMALNHLGISAVVQNTTQNDTETTVLNNFYEIAKVQVLSDFDWNFARKYRELTLSDLASPDINFLYAYDYPNDCIATRYLTGKFGKTKKYDVATNSKGEKIILANVSPAILVYTRNISSEDFGVPESYFTSDFVMCLSLYLASLVAVSITGSEARNIDNLKKYKMFIAHAKVKNASEFSQYDEDNSTYIDSRY